MKIKKYLTDKQWLRMTSPKKSLQRVRVLTFTSSEMHFIKNCLYFHARHGFAAKSAARIEIPTPEALNQRTWQIKGKWIKTIAIVRLLEPVRATEECKTCSYIYNSSLVPRDHLSTNSVIAIRPYFMKKTAKRYKDDQGRIKWRYKKTNTRACNKMLRLFWRENLTNLWQLDKQWKLK